MSEALTDWRLVPVEPTTDMLLAPLRSGRFENRMDLRPDIWAAMLAAAPEPLAVQESAGLPIHVGNLPTANHDEYPGLGAWWTQLRIGPEREEVLARIYGESPEQSTERAGMFVEALSKPAVQGEPVGEVRFEFGIPSSVYGELYSEAALRLAPGAKLYAEPSPASVVQARLEAVRAQRNALVAHKMAAHQLIGIPASVGVAEPLEGFAARPQDIAPAVRDMALKIEALQAENERLRKEAARQQQ